MAYLDGKCYHTCPDCKSEYYHKPDPVWGCLLMQYRPCGCKQEQPSLKFEESA